MPRILYLLPMWEAGILMTIPPIGFGRDELSLTLPGSCMSGFPFAANRFRWNSGFRFVMAAFAVLIAHCISLAAEPDEAFRKNVEPVLDKFCMKCHTGETGKGKIDFTKADLVEDRELWRKALQMLRRA